MRRARRFGVNVLGWQHKPFATRATPAGADRFANIDWEPGRHGAPLLTDALATLECEIVAEHTAGDHSIVVGRVDNLRVSLVTNDPLVFFAGTFTAVQEPRPCCGSTWPERSRVGPVQPEVSRPPQRRADATPDPKDTT